MIQKPNSDQADSGSLAGAMKHFIDGIIADMADMLPARVVSYDSASNRAVVQPLVMLVGTDGQTVPRASVANIPVFRFGGGGFFISMPVKAGDIGWIKACDRDISLIFQRGGMQDKPNTKRKHSFSDAMFFPDAIKGWSIKHDGALVIQSLSGGSCIAVYQDKVVIESGSFECDANATFKKTVLFEQPVELKSGISQNGKSIGTDHVHSGVEKGGSNTGGVA